MEVYECGFCKAQWSYASTTCPNCDSIKVVKIKEVSK